MERALKGEHGQSNGGSKSVLGRGNRMSKGVTED